MNGDLSCSVWVLGGVDLTRALSITKRQAKTLLRAAEEEGGIVEVETAIGIVRLIPQSIASRTEKLDEAPKGYF